MRKSITDEFPYKARFEVSASFKKSTVGKYEASASISELQELRSLLPPDEEMKANDDLLYCSFNLAVAGLINANNHGILPETAIQLLPFWQHRPLNIEHQRSITVGVITQAGFSSFPDNKIISTEAAAAATSPFNIAIGGVVWRVVDPHFADFLEATNEEENEWCYKSLSTSWEVGFSEYIIARGSKNLFSAEIIRDEDEIKRLTPFLTQFGGTGFDDKNTEVYLVISGEARALGGGFTVNPAASVSGVFVPDLESEEEEEEEEEEEDEPEMKDDPSLEMDDRKKCESTANIISQKRTLTVKRIKSMKYKNIDEFCDSYAEAIAKQEVVATSDLREFFKTALLQEVEGWQSKLTEQETRAAAAETRVDELQAEINTSKEGAKEQGEQLTRVLAEFEALKASIKEKEEMEIAAGRVAKLKEKYTISDKLSNKIIEETKGQSDEAFASWLAEDGELLLAGRERVAETPEEGLKEVKASIDFVPNAGSEKEEEQPKETKASVKRVNKEGFVISLS